ncbi:hypothetical protein BJV74DRAFT_715522, partial [Russula compacta]
LQEIDILVKGHCTEARVYDPGSQIVAIWKDLANEVSAHINPSIRLEMESTSGSRSWTLGCAEYLIMQIRGTSFKLHAHIVPEAPFRLLLSHLFQKLLCSTLEDMPDGCVNVTICNP